MNIYTKHSMDRSKARGIPPLIMKWLLDYGTEQYHNNRQILYFDKKARRSLRRAVGRQIVSKLNKYMKSYLVIEDGRVITVGHRFARIRRK